MLGGRLLLPCGVLLTAGCGNFISAAACDAAIYRAVDVEVRDARTGQWAAAGATGEVQDGAYRDSLRVVGWRGAPPNDTAATLGAALGRVGTYTVRVRRDGYQPWERAGVRARAGECSVRTARITAELQPLTP